MHTLNSREENKVLIITEWMIGGDTRFCLLKFYENSLFMCLLILISIDSSKEG